MRMETATATRMPPARSTRAPTATTGTRFDLVLLDGAWSLYLPVLRILESRLAPGALVIAENAVDESGDYLTYVRDPGSGYRSLPLPFEPGRGNEMSVYVA